MSKGKAIGGSVGAIAILLASQTIGQLVGSLFFLLRLPQGICVMIAGFIYLACAYILLKLFVQNVLKIQLASLGFPKVRFSLQWLIAGLLLPIVVKGVYLLLPGQFVSARMSAEELFSTLSTGIVFTGLAAGFVEEMVFRGVILHLLEKGWNRCLAIFAPSFLFGLVHILGMEFSLLSICLVLISGTMVGIMFSLITLESGSIWNSGIVHVLWNIIILGGGLSIGATVNPGAAMTYVLESKSFLLTGGEFGIESSAVAAAAYALVALIAARMLKSRGTAPEKTPGEPF